MFLQLKIMVKLMVLVKLAIDLSNPGSSRKLSLFVDRQREGLCTSYPSQTLKMHTLMALPNYSDLFKH